MSKGLKENALSVIDTVTLAVAGTAPSYSLNATTAALVAAVGLASPGALLYAAIPMFGISVAFMHLNRWRADAGTAYAWVGRSINPVLGFLCAWTFLVLSTAFMVAAALPVGVTTLNLIAPQYQDNVLLATIAGGIWFVAVATLTIVGVNVATKFQRVMTAIEVISLLVLAIGAFVKFSANPVNPFSWAWFSPTAFGNFQTFIAGMLVAMFYYFGWDVSSNVAEESKNANSVPGNSGVLGMVGIFLLFLLLQVAIQMGLTPDQVEKNSADLLPALGDAILPRPWGSIAILAVLVSTIGTIETQLTQCARTLFSMGRDRVIHEKFD
jgi:amino acid transporter